MNSLGARGLMAFTRMSARFYKVVHDLHLYLGLFISPFVLVFSISVFFIVHAWLPKISEQKAVTRIVPEVPLPADFQNLSGRKLVDAVRPSLDKANISGEVSFIRHQVNEHKLVIPLIVPGRETTVTINTTNREATIVSRETGLADALVTLHKFPGPHLEAIRMNWFWMTAWRWLADATVYLLLFISVSGIYLWCVLREERRVGYVLLSAGAIVFFGMIYGLCR
jgi:hypothetical protein